jgi:hypothetical protein
MTGTCAACLHTNQSRSYLNHLVVSMYGVQLPSALNKQFRQPTKSCPLVLGWENLTPKRGHIRDKKIYRGLRAWKMDMR